MTVLTALALSSSCVCLVLIYRRMKLTGFSGLFMTHLDTNNILFFSYILYAFQRLNSVDECALYSNIE